MAGSAGVDRYASSGIARGVPARVRIVTDSASDILPSHARALGIILVPNRIVLDGAVMRDGVDLTAAQFYAALARNKSLPYSLPVPPEDLYSAYEFAFRQGATEVVSIHVSGRLSQVVEHALAARNAFNGARISVIDTYQAGIGMWPAVIQAAHLAQLGAPAGRIEEEVRAVLRRTRLFFMVESLEYLRRSGRIGWAREVIGTLLDAHPLLTLRDGTVVPLSTARPRLRALERLRDLALETGSVERLLMCGTSVELMGQMEAVLRPRYRGIIQNTWLGPTLGVNTGPGVAISVVMPESHRPPPGGSSLATGPLRQAPPAAPPRPQSRPPVRGS
ncbi:MAG: DegV family protein [Ktedonobacterales bacterium]